MKLLQFSVGVVGTNCYFVVNEETKHTIIIDPGDEADRLGHALDENELVPEAILLTHAHFDHIMAVDEFVDAYRLPVYIHEADADMLTQPQLNSGAMIGRSVTAKADHFLRDGDVLHLAGMDISVLHTPGHTPGGACFYFPDEGIVFSGDTLFCESVGRTDLPGGSMSALVRSIKEKLLKLSDLTIVYPGHGEPTKIGTEKQYNPFL